MIGDPMTTRSHGSACDRSHLSLVCAVALALFAALSTTAPAADLERPAATRGKLAIAPEQGRSYKAGPVAVLVRAKRVDRVRVQLNGVLSTGGWSQPGKRLRKQTVSPDHGLRYGMNLLRISVKRKGARHARAQLVRFRIQGRAPLAAAGRDRRVAAGTGLRLDGTNSTLHPQVRRAGGTLRQSWRLLRAPKGSRLATGKGRLAGGVIHRGGKALFTATDGAMPRFRPDQPGVYRFEVRVRGPRGRLARDDVALRVDPDPMVEIDTMAQGPGGVRGIRVGSQFYPDPGEAKKWLQVLVLRQGNLELVSNKPYACPQATEKPWPNATGLAAVGPCVKALLDDVQALKRDSSRYLLIAVSQRPEGGVGQNAEWGVQPPIGAWASLAPIAGPGFTYSHPDRQMLRGRLSFIGSVGGGSAASLLTHDNNDLAEVWDDGRIVGALLRDNRGDYSTYSSFEHLPFDTQAEGSDGTRNVMRIGNSVVSQQIGNGGGFHVVIAEARDLAYSSFWFNTPGNLTPAQLTRVLNEMREVLARPLVDWRSGMVFIATRGDAWLSVPPNQSPPELNTAAQQLVDLLSEHYGASRNRLYRALDPYLGPEEQRGGQRSYTLVSAVGTAPGEAIEGESAGTKASNGLGLNTAPFAGTLTRSGPAYNFEFEASAEAEALEGAGMKLREATLGKPGAWPEQGNPARVAAVRRVTDEVGLDTRRAYLWTRAANFDWKPTTAAIEAVTHPGGDPGYSADDLAWAKRELVTEIGWLQTARGYAADLAEPFASSELQEWAAFEKIATEINLKVKAPEADKTGAKALLLFDSIRELAGQVPGVDKVVGVVNVVYNTAMEWSRIDSEGTEAGDPFQVRVGDVGVELAARLHAAQSVLKNQMVQVIASDYEKLRTVGLCAANLKTCPDGPVAEWQITPDDQRQIARAVDIGTRTLVYQALLPAKFDAWTPPRSPWRSVNWAGHQPAGEAGLLWFCPFNKLPESAQLSYPLRRGINSTTGAPDTWQVVAYAERTGSGTLADPHAMVLPDASVTDSLFKSPAAGGLGANAEAFFLRGWGSGRPGVIKPFEAAGTTSESEYGFPLKDSPVRWISKDDPPLPKTASCGYG
jgi:hypothetical protein